MNPENDPRSTWKAFHPPETGRSNDPLSGPFGRSTRHGPAPPTLFSKTPMVSAKISTTDLGKSCSIFASPRRFPWLETATSLEDRRGLSLKISGIPNRAIQILRLKRKFDLKIRKIRKSVPGHSAEPRELTIRRCGFNGASKTDLGDILRFGAFGRYELGRSWQLLRTQQEATENPVPWWISYGRRSKVRYRPSRSVPGGPCGPWRERWQDHVYYCFGVDS